ncbi:MAG TPA: RNA 2',3'-cyclic phosphodiesterase, partial [Anaerolineales bacterium]|nr:RNA 2',3'-cyclic phosphodiesterase [Anaerolineales bacterium]
MSSVIRAFIAIELSPEIRARLEEVIQTLKSRLEPSAVRWTPANNIHLTLKFLGNVSDTNIEVLQKLLGATIGNHDPFEISVGDIGAFPSTRRPRVLWSGVQAPADLAQLQHAIEAETA